MYNKRALITERFGMTPLGAEPMGFKAERSPFLSPSGVCNTSMRGFSSLVGLNPRHGVPQKREGDPQEGAAQVGGLVSSVVDRDPGDSVHQQLESK